MPDDERFPLEFTRPEPAEHPVELESEPPAAIDLDETTLDVPTKILELGPEAGPPPGDAPDLILNVPDEPEHQAATSPTPAFMDRFDAIEAGLNRKLDTLQTAFDREIRAEATREKVVDRLHSELQEYKQGLILGILRPIFIDLIQLHDDIGKMAAPATEATEEPHPEVNRLLTMILGYQQAIEDILYRQGVETFTLEGDTFDPRRQRALSTVPTEDPALNKKVATHVRKGFQSNDKVIRPEFVTVHAHKP